MPSAAWFLTDDVPPPGFREQIIRTALPSSTTIETKTRPGGSLSVPSSIIRVVIGRSKDVPVAMAILGVSTLPSRYDGQTIVIDRYASHPERSPNTGT